MSYLFTYECMDSCLQSHTCTSEAHSTPYKWWPGRDIPVGEANTVQLLHHLGSYFGHQQLGWWTLSSWCFLIAFLVVPEVAVGFWFPVAASSFYNWFCYWFGSLETHNETDGGVIGQEAHGQQAFSQSYIGTVKVSTNYKKCWIGLVQLGKT